jgi:hypothetical protein
VNAPEGETPGLFFLASERQPPARGLAAPGRRVSGVSPANRKAEPYSVGPLPCSEKRCATYGHTYDEPQREFDEMRWHSHGGGATTTRVRCNDALALPEVPMARATKPDATAAVMVIFFMLPPL